ncbi:Hypothetical protein NGAL_HAMBI1145_09690 [Neorhizobium galegae bv. officinalis]|uniref:Uncharacterized protein n=1 Tax=Neorhizobium galegae bv. officinalis TaxID=323656 RepID=A0A0T7FB02_NEOGA|nr:hypothetical protein [Neorhizobium galegae]CDZ32198.1 Hypothetical protein NGAL_HAMBI1145_09690 [Neorhizobium galegae bv. officinalis]
MLAESKKTIPPEAETPCAAPVVIPDRKISAGETTSLWGADRSALRVCEFRRQAAVSTIRGTP